MKIYSSNLNNSIRFYNRLFDKRPTRITYNYALYNEGSQPVEVIETPASTQVQVPVVIKMDQKALQAAFKRTQSLMKTGQSGTCTILENGFKLTDPDGLEWILVNKEVKVHELKEITNSRFCYLEPVNF